MLASKFLFSLTISIEMHQIDKYWENLSEKSESQTETLDLHSTFIPYDLGLKKLDFFFLVLKFWTIRGLSHEQLDPIPLLGRIKLPQKCYLGFIPAPITPFSPPSACNSIYFDDSMVGDLFSLWHQYKEVQSIELHCTYKVSTQT